MRYAYATRQIQIAYVFEDEVERMITHEELHRVLHKYIGKQACSALEYFKGQSEWLGILW